MSKITIDTANGKVGLPNFENNSTLITVSYTHLDVYKRQVIDNDTKAETYREY